MKILIINIDSKKIPNLALKKIEKYHKDKGDEIIWDMPIFKDSVDKAYASCIFTWNRNQCQYLSGVDIGGSGFDLTKKLPPEIEKIEPHINLGFTTRGCIRNCKFCIVPKKEGKIRVVGDLLNLWDRKSKNITLLDNNILALPEHFELICRQARENKIRLDFNQRLDHRLLNQNIINIMKSISHAEYRFAFDHPAYKSTVSKAITLLRKNKINRCQWYVLIGFNTTFQEHLERLKYLKRRNQNAYVQRYNYTKDPIYIPLAQWANQNHIFHGMTWEQFIDHPKNKKSKKRLQERNCL